jgi:hypothetical protein
MDSDLRPLLPGENEAFKKMCDMQPGIDNFSQKFNATESSSQRKLGSSAFDAL